MASLADGREFFAVERDGTRVILVPDRRRRLPVGLRRQELGCARIATELERILINRGAKGTYLHLAKLVVAPRVHLHRPDKAAMDEMRDEKKNKCE